MTIALRLTHVNIGQRGAACIEYAARDRPDVRELPECQHELDDGDQQRPRGEHGHERVEQA